MKKLENYSEEEWNIVSTLPHLVGMSMSGIAASGIVGTTKEMIANSKAWKNAKEKYADNHLIQAMMPSLESFGESMSEAKLSSNKIMDKIKSSEVKDAEEMADMVMHDADRAMDILEEKESRETVEEFKLWLLEIAEDVAKAGVEGDFFGFGGTEYSEKEKQLFDDLNDSLNKE
ncbi:hypothetical protein NMK71_05325 [Weeksellaceae bacterium KMM 9713]|uniref:Uncharacterized protein n=1 Tax=Profundicola chukchiensis TaxID=2961959 RepID=A0A9X4MZI8_9FLAO|nr:hypothetical protein [Profundicola chukchiensis]MDG4945827.1 hypothetical protein [Profundicola chukchiensis]MDG4951489.1 hypothetical protein [Profundicola chukchiensis]